MKETITFVLVQPRGDSLRVISNISFNHAMEPECMPEFTLADREWCEKAEPGDHFTDGWHALFCLPVPPRYLPVREG